MRLTPHRVAHIFDDVHPIAREYIRLLTEVGEERRKWMDAAAREIGRQLEVEMTGDAAPRQAAFNFDEPAPWACKED